MSNNSKKASITSLPTKSPETEPAPVTFADGDLGMIQSILFRTASLEIEQRITALEAANQAQFKALEQRLTEKLQHLTQLDSEKVNQENLSKLLAGLSRDLGPSNS
ncbi:hypothetical protein IMCC3135_19580 [Granulosicoccus antarcticus IMCC3135]|uniref:Uncharacterized protein n=2 Tax=Granulosicoccus TaxID=437504 RepID=A0A2Z2NU25_9GAMM|nr:hypothetical protein IMCC3135_19580 [Granulosicoccus antarcticus IMCC3135]